MNNSYSHPKKINLNRASTDFWLNLMPWNNMGYSLDRIENKPLDFSIKELYTNVSEFQSKAFSTGASLSTFAENVQLDEPYVNTVEILPLSIVVTSRNDTHVERMEDRSQVFINCILFLAEKYKTNVELTIVEWNPPKDRPLMDSAFHYPESHDYVSIRIIKVDDHIHRRYQWSEVLPLYQMIAKNVGVRRARGKFILATNIDILLSEELFVEITSERMNKGIIYRSNRWDIDRSGLDIETPELQIEKSASLCFQINYSTGIYAKEDAVIVEQLKQTKANESCLRPSLHIMACGDFQLLHHEDWNRLRGYSELDAYSYHLDSLFALTCFHAGLTELVFDDSYPHFHIDHTLGVKVKADQYEINENKIISHISMLSLAIIHNRQLKEADYFIYNDANWGLAGDNLPESTVTIAAWETRIQYNNNTQYTNDKSSCLDLSTLNNLIDYSKVGSNLEQLFLEHTDFITKTANNRSVYIWGTGEKAQMLLYIFDNNIQVDGFIHGGSTASTMENERIIQAEQFLETMIDDSFIIIASMYSEEIIASIVESGREEGRDFIVLF